MQDARQTLATFTRIAPSGRRQSEGRPSKCLRRAANGHDNPDMSQLRILIPGSAFAALSALLCLWAWWREAQAPCVPSYQVILDSAPPRYLGGPCSPTTRAERFDEAALLMVGTAAILVSVAMLI